jgi:hypothetical protein
MFNYDIRTWNEQQVANWLKENQFGHYANIFIDNDINGEVLLELNNGLLKELGINTVGERVKLMIALRRLRRMCVNATRRMLQEEANQEQGDKTKHYIKVSGPENQTCVVNVQGITDAQAILTKIIHKFHLDADVTKYRLFVSNGDNLRMLPDAELLEICQNPDRPERNRLILLSKQRTHRQHDSTKRKPVPKLEIVRL